MILSDPIRVPTGSDSLDSSCGASDSWLWNVKGSYLAWCLQGVSKNGRHIEIWNLEGPWGPLLPGFKAYPLQLCMWPIS